MLNKYQNFTDNYECQGHYKTYFALGKVNCFSLVRMQRRNYR